jgi:hypothetical protein
MHSLLKTGWLCATIKLTHRKGLTTGSTATCVCPAWEFAADTYHLKWQRLQNKVSRTTDNFPSRISSSELHVAFKILYVYDFITKLCSEQTERVQNHEHVNIRNKGQGEDMHRKCTRFELGGGQAYDRWSDCTDIW